MLPNIFLSIVGLLSLSRSTVSTSASASAFMQFIEKSAEHEEKVSLGTVQSIIDSFKMVPELVELAHDSLVCETQEDPRIIIELLLSNRSMALPHEEELYTQWLPQLREYEQQVVGYLEESLTLMTIDAKKGLCKFMETVKLVCESEPSWPFWGGGPETNEMIDDVRFKGFAFELKERVPEFFSALLGMLEILPRKAELMIKLQLYTQDKGLQDDYTHWFNDGPKENWPKLDLSRLFPKHSPPIVPSLGSPNIDKEH